MGGGGGGGGEVEGGGVDGVAQVGWEGRGIYKGGWAVWEWPLHGESLSH